MAGSWVVTNEDLSDRDRDLSLADFLSHLGQWRWTILGFLILGVALSIPVAYFYAVHHSKVITLKIYATGTPTDMQDQVTDQLGTALLAGGFVPVLGRDPGLFTLRMPYRESDESLVETKVEKLKEVVAAFEHRIDAKVDGVFSAVRDRLKGTERPENVDILVQFNSYLIGRREGMINLVQVSVNDQRPAKWAPVLITALLSLAVAGVGVLCTFLFSSPARLTNRLA